MEETGGVWGSAGGAGETAGVWRWEALGSTHGAWHWEALGNGGDCRCVVLGGTGSTGEYLGCVELGALGGTGGTGEHSECVQCGALGCTWSVWSWERWEVMEALGSTRCAVLGGCGGAGCGCCGILGCSGKNWGAQRMKCIEWGGTQGLRGHRESGGGCSCRAAWGSTGGGASGGGGCGSLRGAGTQWGMRSTGVDGTGVPGGCTGRLGLWDTGRHWELLGSSERHQGVLWGAQGGTEREKGSGAGGHWEAAGRGLRSLGVHRRGCPMSPVPPALRSFPPHPPPALCPLPPGTHHPAPGPPPRCAL